MPVVNRNFTNLNLLAPGATLNTFQHAASENPQQSTLVNTNGQEFAGTNYVLDGMNNNDSVLGITMVNPPIDSVGQVTMITSNYDAEFTQAGGSVVLVETKSGSNTFHGSLFEYLQNNIFESRDPLTQGLHDPGTPAPPHRGVPELRYNQFGGSIGGPVIKNKIFFFLDYQATLRRAGASQLIRVPTAAERTGDLSDLGVPIYNPSTGNPDGTGRAQFPNGVIPSSMISAPAAKLLSALPLPNLTPANPAAPNFAVSLVEQYPTHNVDVRGDEYLTDKLRYFVRYSSLLANVNAPGAFGLYGGPGFPTWGFTGNSNAHNQNGAFGANYDFGPNLLTEARFGFSRYDVTVNPLDIGQPLATQVGIPGLNIPGRPDTFGLPDLNINGTGGTSGSGGVAAGTGALTLGYSCNCPLHERETLIDFVNNWTKVYGNHTFKWGADIELAWNLRLPSDQHRAGVYNFNPSVTSLGPTAIGGSGVASFLLGLPSQFQRFSQISTNQEDRQNRMFYFVQDTWRITHKLTLSYGLRWDTWFPDYSLNPGQGGRYDVTTNTVLIPGVGGISQSANGQTQWHNFAPRLAIAYALNDKTVIRAGYGRSYFQGTFGWTFNNLAADVYPYVITQQINTSSPYLPVFPLTTAPPAAVFSNHSSQRPLAVDERNQPGIPPSKSEALFGGSVELHRRAPASWEHQSRGRLCRKPWPPPQWRFQSQLRYSGARRRHQSTTPAVRDIWADRFNLRQVRLHQQQLQCPSGARREALQQRLLAAGILHLVEGAGLRRVRYPDGPVQRAPRLWPGRLQPCECLHAGAHLCSAVWTWASIPLGRPRCNQSAKRRTGSSPALRPGMADCRFRQPWRITHR